MRLISRCVYFLYLVLHVRQRRERGKGEKQENPLQRKFFLLFLHMENSFSVALCGCEGKYDFKGNREFYHVENFLLNDFLNFIRNSTDSLVIFLINILTRVMMNY